eukprot:TRINITY_DN53767_c0_g1_i1.p2 TRINITY_DN53767_c0_g1~~TRINITY_DN53767_c0_g1_i1.p2  ORF type:complete len:171 (-),score=45.35 TRINITY_DN53767_c0_g1_i1:1-513(-)
MLEEKPVSNKEYFMRALAFARPHWLLFVLAFGSLVVSTGCSMLLPAIQGRILDSIIAADRDSFEFNVKCMAVLSVVVGLFGGLRGLFFSLATRRVAVSVRNLLFSRIVSQDIAFFDGSTVGDLTSRLNGDVQAMVCLLYTSDAADEEDSVDLVGGSIVKKQKNSRNRVQT